MVQALLDGGAKVDYPDQNHSTPLMIASHYNHAPIVELLVDRGANPDLVDQMGRTAFDWGASSEIKIVLFVSVQTLACIIFRLLAYRNTAQRIMYLPLPSHLMSRNPIQHHLLDKPMQRFLRRRNYYNPNSFPHLNRELFWTNPLQGS